jgi:hypothetical protein
MTDPIDTGRSGCREGDTEKGDFAGCMPISDVQDSYWSHA